VRQHYSPRTADLARLPNWETSTLYVGMSTSTNAGTRLFLKNGVDRGGKSAGNSDHLIARQQAAFSQAGRGEAGEANKLAEEPEFTRMAWRSP